MVTMGVFPLQGNTQMVEPEIEPGTSWLVVRSSDHQATRLVGKSKVLGGKSPTSHTFVYHKSHIGWSGMELAP